MSISHSPKSDHRFSVRLNRQAQPQKTASPAVFLLRQTAFIHNPVLHHGCRYVLRLVSACRSPKSGLLTEEPGFYNPVQGLGTRRLAVKSVTFRQNTLVTLTTSF